MTAQEIFRLPAIDFIETEICDLYWQYEHHCYYNKAIARQGVCYG